MREKFGLCSPIFSAMISKAQNIFIPALRRGIKFVASCSSRGASRGVSKRSGMWRPLIRLAAASPGGPGTPPGGSVRDAAICIEEAVQKRKTACEELADGEPGDRFTKSAARGPKSPRWSAGRRGVLQGTPTTKMLRRPALHHPSPSEGADQNSGGIPPREQSNTFILRGSRFARAAQDDGDRKDSHARNLCRTRRSSRAVRTAFLEHQPAPRLQFPAAAAPVRQGVMPPPG
jgi:hypothetical protein